MTRARILQEVRQMRFEELYERRQQREITMAEAAEMLGVTERTFRRWSGRYDAEGAEGLQDRRIGRASARAVPVDDVVAMLALYQTRYTGWTVKHFHERWHTDHGGTRSYSWTKQKLQAAANRYLTEQFLPQHNERFMVRATEPGTAFIPWVGTSLAEILCVQEERVVAKDNTVHYHRHRLQIPQNPHRFHYVKVTVRVHEYPDGTLAVFHGPRCLARYHADGQFIEIEGESRRRKDPTPRSDDRPIVDPRATVRDTILASG